MKLNNFGIWLNNNKWNEEYQCHIIYEWWWNNYEHRMKAPIVSYFWFYFSKKLNDDYKEH